ncbi:hypothetical protein BR93DRAFT_985335 [Coniochaeta sp. PMI_546]|nr:hypothetical protein BR93DRAFT_985335 [Coniochaeta sp. PMI_546]
MNMEAPATEETLRQLLAAVQELAEGQKELAEGQKEMIELLRPSMAGHWGNTIMAMAVLGGAGAAITVVGWCLGLRPKNLWRDLVLTMKGHRQTWTLSRAGRRRRAADLESGEGFPVDGGGGGGGDDSDAGESGGGGGDGGSVVAGGGDGGGSVAGGGGGGGSVAGGVGLRARVVSGS